MHENQHLKQRRILRLDTVRDFRVASIVGGQCTLVDHDEKTVFVGTLRQCEDWLDARENDHVGRFRSTSWFHKLWNVGVNSIAGKRS